MASVRMAISESRMEVSSYNGSVYVFGHQTKTSKNEITAINALCNLYGSRFIESNWHKLESIVTSGASIGRIMSESIVALKRM